MDGDRSCCRSRVVDCWHNISHEVGSREETRSANAERYLALVALAGFRWECRDAGTVVDGYPVGYHVRVLRT